jgi:hypothetical protein
LFRTGRVGFTEDLDDTSVREPIGNGSTSPQSLSEFRTGNIGSWSTLGHLVDRLVLVGTRQVSHSLERNHFNLQLVLELSNELLRVVRTVEVFTLRVLSRSGVITSDNEVGGSEVFSDNSVPNGLSGSSHSHSQRKEGEVSHTFGVRGHERLVSSDTGVVVDISGLGKTDNGVDEDVGPSLTGGSDSKLSVGSVHGVSGLESNDLAPCELVEVVSELGGGVCVRQSCDRFERIPLTSESNIVEVLRGLDGLDVSTNVELLGLVVEVERGWVGDIVRAKNLLGLESLVGLVDIGNWG